MKRKPRKARDWVDDLVDSGVTGHKPRGKFKPTPPPKTPASRSVMRRIAAQKGEPAPSFETPAWATKVAVGISAMATIWSPDYLVKEIALALIKERERAAGALTVEDAVKFHKEIGVELSKAQQRTLFHFIEYQKAAIRREGGA